ncbi:unnamed protein product [Mytilus coruscus]|uniref:G domain-containing protein n=1 Tax=Mytilus coruscus TaxID=42192 RepID=A0A6J8DNW6_MYTCO|nr:unnamed protein product [Mytilus coruscus]
MTDLTGFTEKLFSELASNIESNVTTSKTNISKIERGTKSYHEEVKTGIKRITEEGNYWKKLIDKKVEALIKLVQDVEQKEIQNVSAYSLVNREVLENCQIWQQNLNETETTAGVRFLLKLTQIQTDVDQIELKQVPDAPSVSYREKTPSGIEIDNLFEELQFRKDFYVHLKEEITFAVIGAPGSGKSESANTILGVTRCEKSSQGQSVTKEIQCEHVNENEINLTDIDTLVSILLTSVLQS